MKLFPELRRKLKTVHPVWQIVVGEKQIRPQRGSRDQFQRCNAVTGRRHLIAFIFEKKFEEVSYFGIVFDDQDRSGAGNPSSGLGVRANAAVLGECCFTR